ncbi:MAG: 4Fe-4S binding protein [Bacteroidetes bacterium]|nr:4Fe-4S binding protein [Rhodothermia bacterium]MCS7155521.1 4Fe-4S binding protein [Bacteroidota bacterium]MCX7907386.1 4Fe-4S binding protein [Bacteroidota bacterium]MDW8138380.1 4Fe-4S binding protein [Bacteroidota bacterium]MDW8284683.1 4Fe-4S binding protein [Bacteroidota bacterium]
MPTRTGYFTNLRIGVETVWAGLRLTLGHLRQARRRRRPVSIADPDYFRQPDGQVTVRYPHEAVPVPDTGRYRLHNDIDDCIGCLKCARICPVDCITIETIKAVEDLGTTSNGQKKRLWIARFDIDMAKCCYCGLCTMVCPTECLTMTKVHDFSEFDRDNMVYHFANLTPEEVEEKRRLAEAAAVKPAAPARAASAQPASAAGKSALAPRAVSRPEAPGDRDPAPNAGSAEAPHRAKPAFAPRPVPRAGADAESRPAEPPSTESEQPQERKPAAKPFVFKKGDS